MLHSGGVYFDDLHKLRVVEPEVVDQSDKLREECTHFIKRTTEYKKIADKFISQAAKLAEVVEREKLKALGLRSLLESSVNQQNAKQEQLQIEIMERKMELERLKAQIEALAKVDAEQKELLDQLAA